MEKEEEKNWSRKKEGGFFVGGGREFGLGFGHRQKKGRRTRVKGRALTLREWEGGLRKSHN